MELKLILEKVEKGFTTLDVADKHKQAAISNLKGWLTDSTLSTYYSQIQYLIKKEKWDMILDSFYQMIPFGTGGRRGPVGIGPNRININTIQSSAQGHAQYLLKNHGESAKKRGLVISYDVRKFTQKGIYDDSIDNPVMNLACKDLAKAAAMVYGANGIKIYLFEDVRSTPELSFAIRHLNAISGVMISASHNPPTDNGKKVYDEFGGQLIPPNDQILVDEVTQSVEAIQSTAFETLQENGMIEIIGDKVDQAYVDEVCKLSMSNQRGLSILYSPLHGTGITSVYPALKKLGFDIQKDEKTSHMSGEFENVTFNIPNPEVIESFDTPLKKASQAPFDLILSTDPDADRIGIMVNHDGQYVFLNGNEIGILLTRYGILKFMEKRPVDESHTIIKTLVTSSLIEKIATKSSAACIPDLLVGFKYIADKMNILEKENRADRFILGTEESHGYIMGNYCRDKDAAGAAVWLAELAAELKTEGKTLIHYLDDIYAEYGYCHNYLTEIRLLGAKGMEQISMIMDDLRETALSSFGHFNVKEKIDRWANEPMPHLSKTDTSSRNVLIFDFDNLPHTQSIRVIVRPSGTEPKIKMYFEVFGKPFKLENIVQEKNIIIEIRSAMERIFMKYCYNIIGVDFPERGFLLFWQLPLMDKLKYFQIEEKIAVLKNESDKEERKKKLFSILEFLGSDPIEKVDKAFSEKYQSGILSYLDLQ